MLPHTGSWTLNEAILAGGFATSDNLPPRFAQLQYAWRCPSIDMAEAIDHESVGVAADVYHVWWDPDLADEIARCGRLRRLFGFHVCDWRVPTRDFLNDRGVVGEGCIDVRGIREMVEATGFDGLHEIEIFSDEGWSLPQDAWLERVLRGYADNG